MKKNFKSLELIYDGNKIVDIDKSAIDLLYMSDIYVEIVKIEDDPMVNFSKCKIFRLDLNTEKVDEETKQFLLKNKDLLGFTIIYEDNSACNIYVECYKNNQNGCLETIDTIVDDNCITIQSISKVENDENNNTI